MFEMEFEEWNRSFNSLVGHHHLWVLIQALQRDYALTSNTFIKNARQSAPMKRAMRSTAELQKKLLQRCSESRDGLKSIGKTLLAIGHTIRHPCW